MRRWLRLTLGAILAFATLTGAPRAETVIQEYLGLDVIGNLEIAGGSSLAKDGAVLIVHGSAGHHGLEVVATLQRNLKSRGINSLAITLSLGLPRRTGMFDCNLEHDHRHADGGDEIIAWVEWLQKKGASNIALLGHSRGGAQSALAIVERADAGVRSLILAAPLYQTEAEIGQRYAQAFGQPLAPLMAQARRKVEEGEGDTLVDVPGFLHCRPAKVTAAAFHDYYAPDPQVDVLVLLGQVTVPTLVVVAGDDMVTPELPAALAASRAGRFLSSRVETVTIDGADHFFRDLFGDELADRVAEFLKAK